MTGPKDSKLNTTQAEEIANIVYICRMKLAASTADEQDAFFDLLTDKLLALRFELKDKQ